MAGSLLPEPKQQFLNDIGDPLFAGQIFTYAAGTLTPKATYQDQALTIANTNPVVANARGEVVMYGSGSYRVILKDSFGNTIYDRDNIETVDVATNSILSTFASSVGSSLVGFIQSGIGALIRTVMDKLRERITPQDFGAVGDGVADDTAAMQAWIARVVAAPTLMYEASGIFKVTQPLVFNFSAYATCEIRWAAEIRSSISTLSDVLTVNGSFFLKFTGKLTVTGVGSSVYSSRVNRTGIVINDCSRFSYDTIRTTYFLSHGMSFTGLTSQPSGKYHQAWYCGSNMGISNGAFLTGVATVGAKTGSAGSVTQAQTVTLTAALPAYVDINGWFLRIRGALYKIKTMTTTSNITVYPYLHSSVIAGDTIELIGGAGHYTFGSDVSCGRVGTLDALGCGVGFQSLSLYPTNLGNYVAQNNGIVAHYGANIGAAMTSSDINYLYCESNVFGIIPVSTSAFQLRIGPTVTFPVSASYRMAPREADDSFSPYFQGLGPGVSYIGDNGMVRCSNAPARGFEYSNFQAYIEDGSEAAHSFLNNNQNVTLNDPTVVNLVGGLRAMTLTFFGTGANNQPTGTITITPQPTHTINGGAAGAAVTYSGMTKALQLRLIWCGGVAWRISRWDAV